MSRFAFAGAFLLASALAGCSGPIGSSSYPGDPRLVVQGQVTSTDQLGPTEIALVWQLGAPPSMDQLVPDFGVGVPQTRSTDPWFTIRIYDPPPPYIPLQRLRDGEVALARGNLVAIPLGWRPDDIRPPMVTEEPGFGADVGHWIVYLDGPAQQGTLTAWWLRAPLGLHPGYHLVRVEPFAPTCMTADERAACITAVVTTGVPEAEAASYCDAPYRLSVVDPWVTQVEIQLGVFSVPPPAVCPPP